MRTGPAGLALIKSFETCELQAYPDPGSALGRECAIRKLPMREYRQVSYWEMLNGNPWTIAWGHTGTDVFPGLIIQQQHADAFLEQDLASAEKDVQQLVKVPLTQGQFDALVSFVYNVGSDIDADNIAEGLGDSTLLKKLNAGDYAGAAAEFGKWTKSGGVIIGGLVRRRRAERDLFLGTNDGATIKQTAQ
jgi:lysozyme